MSKSVIRAIVIIVGVLSFAGLALLFNKWWIALVGLAFMIYEGE